MRLQQILFTLLLAISLPAWARVKVSVGAIEGQGTKESDIQVLAALVRAEIRSDGSFELVESGNEGTITGTLIRLENSYILQLTLSRPEQSPRSRQAKTESFSEMDVAVRRVVKALGNNSSVDATAKRGEILQREQQTPTRIRSIRGYEVFFGISYPLFDVATTNGDKPLMGTLGYGYAWDVRNMLVEARGDVLFAMDGSGVAALTGGLAANVFFYEGATASYMAGGEFGLGIASSGREGKFGFHFAGDIGALLLRETDISLDFRFRLGFLTASFKDDKPIFAGLLVGLHF